jgi:ABC-type phosphate/phosphonate transport system substrate-binding protein
MRPFFRSGFVLAALLLAAPWSHALVFAINEGVSYKVPLEEVRTRFAVIGADLSKILKQPVTIEPIGEYAALRKGLADKHFDLAMVHPAHISIVAIRQSGYKLVVETKGYQQYTAQFLVKADSPFKVLHDIKDERIGAPDEDSITAVMMRAMFVEAGLDPKKLAITYTRYQEAMPFFVDNGLTKTAVTAAGAVIKAWTGKGGRILAKSRPVPIKHIIASPNLSADQVEKVREYLLGLEASDEGKKKLEPTRYTGFEKGDEAALLTLGKWLGV